MFWTDEPDSFQSGLLNLVLVSEDEINLCLVEFLKRILTDAISSAKVAPWNGIAFDILERQYEEDENCYLHASFVDGSNKSCKGISRYYLRNSYFTNLHGEDESSHTFNRIQLEWFLKQYQLIKDCLKRDELLSLLKKLEGIRPVSIHAATTFGWFDLQIAEDNLGELPKDDQAILDKPIEAIEEPKEESQESFKKTLRLISSLELTPGSSGEEINAESETKELAEALLQAAPLQFKSFHCKVTRGLLYGKHALFFHIESQEFPDQAMEIEDEQVSVAANKIVALITKAGSFHGLQLKLETQVANEGHWKVALEVLQKV